MISADSCISELSDGSLNPHRAIQGLATKYSTATGSPSINCIFTAILTSTRARSGCSLINLLTA